MKKTYTENGQTACKQVRKILREKKKGGIISKELNNLCTLLYECESENQALHCKRP